MRRQKLRYKVNWQGALEQEVIKQTGIKQVLLVLPTTDRKEMCNIRDRWQKNICTLISTITAECTTLFVGEYQRKLQRKSVEDYLADAEYRFQYEIDTHVTSVLHKIFSHSRCRPLGSIVETTSGVGARNSAITEHRKNARQIEIIRGRSIQKYMTLNTFFFEFNQENVTGRTVDRSKLGVREKVLLRKTGFPIFATYDDSGIYPEQSLYFLFNNRTDTSLKYVTAVLNSKLFQFVYYNRLITTKDSTPYLKKVDLDRFPLYLCEGKDRESHDFIVEHVDRLMRLYQQKSKALLSQQLKHIEREIEHYEEQIDTLIYRLYGLTAEEIAIVEGD
jgi:hypothetical protein